MDNWIGVAFSLGVGVLFILIGIPLMLGKIAPNRWYGHRTPTTRRDESIWYPVNALTGKYLTILGVVLVVLGFFGLTALNDPKQQQMLVWIALAVVVLCLAWAIYAGQKLSHQRSTNLDIRPPGSN